MCIGNWEEKSKWNEQISGTNIPGEVKGLDWVNWQLTNSLKFNHRQKFRIDKRSDRRHLENINAIFITEKWLRKDQK